MRLQKKSEIGNRKSAKLRENTQRPIMSAVQTTITEQTKPVMVNTELHVPQVETAIKVRGLTKTYQAFEAVKGIDLDIAPGEIFGFIGPDGAGKTSVFQILGGVMQQTSGTAQMYDKA